MIAQEEWQQDGEQLVDHDVAHGRPRPAQREQQVLRELFDWVVEYFSYFDEQALGLRQNDEPLYKVDGLPDLDCLCWLSSLLDVLQIWNSWSLVLQLVELDRLLLFRDILGYAILDEGQLQRSTLPLLR